MKNIAVGMSGGGFRAAAFSMGTLSLLNEVKYQDTPILNNVKFISSTSGGSITNLLYCTAVATDQPFVQSYHKLMEATDGETLIARVFDILKDDKRWNARPEKSRNLINAFSIAYEELMFDQVNFGTINAGLDNKTLEEICVNATEFANGISFRFQSQHHIPGMGKGKIGNQYINFIKTGDEPAADQLKLGDILACSSCFPGGFEPFIFPEDFSHANLTAETLTGSVQYADNPFTSDNNPDDPYETPAFKSNKKRFGIMDGGIADNQAIDGIDLAARRRKKAGRPPFDLILISDVTSYLINGYTLPLAGPDTSWSLSRIARCIFWIGMSFPALILLSLFICWHPAMYLLLLPTGIAFFLYWYGNFKLAVTKASAKKEKSTWLLMLFGYGSYFWALQLNLLTQMLLSRLKSVLMITMDVYLKRIRALYYKQLFSNPNTRNLVIANAIYDLSYVNDFDVKKDVFTANESDNEVDEPQAKSAETVTIAQPSDKIQAVAEKARLVATTLWFDRFHVQDHANAIVVATGQFTTCYNLLKYLIEKRARLQANPDNAQQQPEAYWTEAEDKVIETLTALWGQFITNPFYLYNQPALKPEKSPALQIIKQRDEYIIQPVPASK